MNLKYAVAGLVALGGIALGAGSASAMPNGLSGAGAQPAGITEQVRLVCDQFGRCFRRPNYGYGPRYGYGGPRRYGYGGPRFYDGPRRGGWDRGYGYGGGRW
jgi:hypothetical protein